MAKKTIDPAPIIKQLSQRCLKAKGIECSILGELIDMLKAAPGTEKWIPVSEQLPERFQPVIICRKGGKVETGWRDVNDWWRVYGTRVKTVTHWMPMPEAPEEGE